jgi:hypothetical protein
MLIILLSSMWSVESLFSTPKAIPVPQENNQLTQLRKAVEAGHIHYRLTEPKEIIDILGEPIKKVVRKSGGIDVLEISYPDVSITFYKFRRDKQAPFTLRYLTIKNKKIDIGRNKKLVLRNNNEKRPSESPLWILIRLPNGLHRINSHRDFIPGNY